MGSSVRRILVVCASLCLTGAFAAAQEDCGSAASIPSPLPFSGAGDTSGMSNDLDPGVTTCTDGTAEPGPDYVFRYSPATDEAVRLLLAPQGFDGALYVLDGCDAGSCAAGSDRGLTGDPETIGFLRLLAGREYFVVVDSARPGSAGPFTLDLEPTIDPCASPIPMTAPPFTFSGDLAVETDKFDPGTQCSVWFAPGPDVVFTYTTGATDEVVDFTLTPTAPALDAVLYVAGDCADPAATCVAGADQGFEGATESLTGVFLSAATTYYVFADSWAPGASFRLDMTGGTSPCQTAVDVPAVPFTDSGDTGTETDDFHPPCPGLLALARETDKAYRYTSAAATSVNAVVLTADSGFDPALYVIEDCGTAGSRCLRSADLWATGHGESLVGVDIEPGKDYLFVVDSASTRGTFEFHLDPATDPCTDGVTQVPLPLPYTGAGDTTGRLNSFDAGTGCGGVVVSQPGPDQAFLLVPDRDGFVDVVCTPEPAFNPILYVVSDCTGPGGPCLGGADTGGLGVPETVSFFARQGTAYFVLADSTTGEGAFTIRIDQEAGVCDATHTVSSLPFARSGDTTGRLDRVDDQGRCTGLTQQGRDEVYCFTPAADAYLAATVTPEPGFDPSFYVFADLNDPAGSCVAGSDSALAGGVETVSCVAVTGGTMYYIAVDSFFESDAGSYQLELNAGAPAALLLNVTRPPASPDVALQWAGGCQTMYSVLRGELSALPTDQEIAAVPGTQYTDAGVLPDGIGYFYRVE